jgi:hypothetical protein
MAQYYGDDPRDPDFSVGFWALEIQPFIFGETGVSDGEVLIKSSVEGWLDNSDGKTKIPYDFC